MNIDKSWIDIPNRHSRVYYDGIDTFLTFAYNNQDAGSRIFCPCKKCENRYMYVRLVVQQHIQANGFWKKYKIWEKHGEVIVDVGTVDEDDHNESLYGGCDENTTESSSGPNEPTKAFLKLLECANLPLYPGSKKHTLLSFIVRLLQAKVIHGWSDNSLKNLLEILEEVMPQGALLPKSYYEAQKIVDDLGFTYTTIDACPNSCMLFRGGDVNLDECSVYNSSRCKEGSGVVSSIQNVENVKRRPANQARYFPLQQRLQRLFMCSNTAKLMRWHAEERVVDGVLRHPADSLAWKEFDQRNSSFAEEIRNVRLGLASDGFNPFRSMNIVHSTWPVILVPYNLPPSMCMQQPFIFLSVLLMVQRLLGIKLMYTYNHLLKS
ncbi:hypothetical protein LINGRAHAP2_LOCUS30957 [Linum grandiflorum]